MTTYRSRTLWGTARLNVQRLLHPGVATTHPPEHVVFERDVAVAVRDGTVLRANVFRPEGGGRHPVLLSAQPYGKDALPKRTRRGGYRTPLQYRLAANDEPLTRSAWTGLEAPDPAYWVPRGYVVVLVDLRGWGTSAGAPEPFGLGEGDDVHDAVEWAAAQPWSTGRVGMNGVSYLAISQWSGAATRPPHLAAICPWEGMTDPYPDFGYPGGVRENGFLPLWSTWLKAMRPRSPSFRRAQHAHPLRDGWWQDRAADLERIDVPALVCASFTDQGLHSRGSFEGFRRIGSSEKWLWAHRGPKWAPYYSAAGLALQSRFFDHFLRDEDTGILDDPPVRLEVRSGLHEVAEVRTAQEWPPREVRPTVLHLDAGTGTLSDVAPAASGKVEVGRGGARFAWTLPERLDLVGPMRLRVTISTERDDLTLMPVVRKFHGDREVVFEGAYGFTEDVVTRGWLRASHRGVDETRSSAWEAFHPHTSTLPVVPGRPVDLDLTLLPSATRFDAGDTLVLELRDSYVFPANPLTGQFPAVFGATPRQRWRVHTGSAATSTLTVGVWADHTVEDAA